MTRQAQRSVDWHAKRFCGRLVGAKQGRELMAGSRKLRMGMVGGGQGAVIGTVHRLAAEMDGKIRMVAGSFSQSPELSRAAGERFGIDPARTYADSRQMIDAERKRTDPVSYTHLRAHETGRN